jgi:tetratricopeptide (TPR) repeat protein
MRDQVQNLMGDCNCGSGLLTSQCCGLKQVFLPTPLEKADVENLLKQADLARNNGDLETAAATYIRILKQLPAHIEALFGLAQVRTQQKVSSAAIVLLQRCIKIDPNSLMCSNELAMALYQAGNLHEAEVHARNAVRLGPRDAQAHNILGMVLTDIGRPLAGEYHYRRAIELHEPVGKLCANLALNLRQQGKLDESEQWYHKAVELEPDNVSSLLGWVKLEEVRRNFDKAWGLLEKAESLAKESPAILHMRSGLLSRVKRYDEAIEAMDKLEQTKKDVSDLGPGYFQQHAQILDKMQRYDDAFNNYVKANELICKSGRGTYRRQQAERMIARLKAFFTESRYSLMPRSPQRTDVPQPIFIVGFPRSGTTMTEQIITAHPLITAGDELHFIGDLVRFGPKLLNSPMTYPESFADLWMGENQEALDSFRDFYLKRTQQLGILEESSLWFTDKMPLNEIHLGMISMVFPKSPVIHLIRHPLDVVLSTYFTDLTHGFNCAFELQNIVHQYTLVMDLVDHNLSVLDIKYLAIKYEDIVADQEGKSRELLEFIGVEWDERCLEFHKNTRYARTASYAQVTETLYKSSLYRYKNYRKHLEPIIPVLEPYIYKLGYNID